MTLFHYYYAKNHLLNNQTLNRVVTWKNILLFQHFVIVRVAMLTLYATAIVFSSLAYVTITWFAFRNSKFNLLFTCFILWQFSFVAFFVGKKEEKVLLNVHIYFVCCLTWFCALCVGIRKTRMSHWKNMPRKKFNSKLLIKLNER